MTWAFASAYDGLLPAIGLRGGPICGHGLSSNQRVCRERSVNPPWDCSVSRRRCCPLHSAKS